MPSPAQCFDQNGRFVGFGIAFCYGGSLFVSILLGVGRQNIYPPYLGRDGIWQFPETTIDSNTVATVFDTVVQRASKSHGDII